VRVIASDLRPIACTRSHYRMGSRQVPSRMVDFPSWKGAGYCGAPWSAGDTRYPQMQDRSANPTSPEPRCIWCVASDINVETVCIVRPLPWSPGPVRRSNAGSQANRGGLYAGAVRTVEAGVVGIDHRRDERIVARGGNEVNRDWICALEYRGSLSTKMWSDCPGKPGLKESWSRLYP
jgi:hypothetical protein